MSDKPSARFIPGPVPENGWFSIGQAAELCGVKPHVLRYWESEFSEISPAKRRGNRRYYTTEEVLVIRHIRSLLYERGLTIDGAKKWLKDERKKAREDAKTARTAEAPRETETGSVSADDTAAPEVPAVSFNPQETAFIRERLQAVLEILDGNGSGKREAKE